jgi:hypothetical protein
VPQSRTRQIALEQTINLKSAVDFANSIGLPLVAHCIFHWVGTDAGDDADGELFAEVRETVSRWLRYRDVPFAAIWVREKKSGGMAEVNTLTSSSTCRELSARSGHQQRIAENLPPKLPPE